MYTKYFTYITSIYHKHIASTADFSMQIPNQVVVLCKEKDNKYTGKRSSKTLEKSILNSQVNLQKRLEKSVKAGYEPPDLDVFVVNKDFRIMTEFASPEDGRTKNIKFGIK